MVVLMKLHTNSTLSCVHIGNNGMPKEQNPSSCCGYTHNIHQSTVDSCHPRNSSMTLKDMIPWSHSYTCTIEFKLSEADKQRRI
jgi:hypothetical protein